LTWLSERRATRLPTSPGRKENLSRVHLTRLTVVDQEDTAVTVDVSVVGSALAIVAVLVVKAKKVGKTINRRSTHLAKERAKKTPTLLAKELVEVVDAAAADIAATGHATSTGHDATLTARKVRGKSLKAKPTRRVVMTVPDKDHHATAAEDVAEEWAEVADVATLVVVAVHVKKETDVSPKQLMESGPRPAKVANRVRDVPTTVDARTEDAEVAGDVGDLVPGREKEAKERLKFLARWQPTMKAAHKKLKNGSGSGNPRRERGF